MLFLHGVAHLLIRYIGNDAATYVCTVTYMHNIDIVK